MRVVGVDPGLTGAIAAWDGKTLEIWDVPSMKAKGHGNEVNVPALVKMVRDVHYKGIDAVFIEKDGGRPNQSEFSGRKAGKTWGLLTGTLAMCCANVFWPTPGQWKKVMKLTKDKDYSITKAVETFPDHADFFLRKKDHNRAEAALLAYYGLIEWRKRRGRKRLADFKR